MNYRNAIEVLQQAIADCEEVKKFKQKEIRKKFPYKSTTIKQAERTITEFRKDIAYYTLLIKQYRSAINKLI